MSLTQILNSPSDQSADKPSISNRAYADYIENGNPIENGDTPFVWNLRDHQVNFGKNTFPKDGKIKFNVSGWDRDQVSEHGYFEEHSPFSADPDGLRQVHRRLAREAFKLYEEHLGIEFIETTDDDADIFITDFSDEISSPYSTTPAENSKYFTKVYPDKSLIHIPYDPTAVSEVARNYYGYDSSFLDSPIFATYVHEIGHSLGLSHDGNYGSSDQPGPTTYEKDGRYLNSSKQSSMMSYFCISSPERQRMGVLDTNLYLITNYNIDANFIEPNTPMPVDWLALDNMYRDQGYGISNSFKGDTRYGLNTSITADTSQVWSKFTKFIEKNAFTIVDGSGYDIIDVSFSDSDQEIDLRQTDPNSDSLYSSDIAGRKGNLYIAASTVIEEAITGAGDDILIGNADNNTLNGGAGSDQLWGHEGANTLKSGDLDGYTDELYVHAGNSQQKRDLLIQVDATDRIYIDGIKDDELTFKSNIDDPTGSNYVGIGIYANGVLEALVVDTVLTVNQISDITIEGEFS